ncbi:MAG TPA: dTDP-4-dehydrorhamnose reductase [Burkholderiales bacterium]|nr:dTDP-4-dehydrorhamnose reductase [Burkholderiales bacterium]
MNILLTGKYGQVGWALHKRLVALGDVLALDREELDLTNADALIRTLREFKPAIIVNPAAYTSVDRAESESQVAHAINARTPEILATEAKRSGALLIHYSTDYVFDGSKRGPYVENDATNPLNAYGRSKLEGEQAIEASDCRHFILRTSWVYGARGHNFLLSMLKLGRERPQLRIVDDQIGAPTWCESLADMTIEMLQGEVKGRLPGGIYHSTDGGETSWCGFAKEIFRLAKIQTLIEPIPTSEYPTPARRPLNSRLDNTKRLKALGTTQRPWTECLAACMRQAGL